MPRFKMAPHKREIIDKCEICRNPDLDGHYHLFEGAAQCTPCYERHHAAHVASVRQDGATGDLIQETADGRVVALHGCIELYVPEGMGAYEAWQELESHLEAMKGDDAGERPSVHGYQLARYFDEAEEFGGGKTSGYAGWLREVSRKD